MVAHDGGGVVLIVGLSAPVLAMLVAATVEYSSLTNRRSKLQTAVDAAAIAGTQQLRLANNTDDSIDGVVKVTIQNVAPTPKDGVTNVSTAVVDNRSSVRVSVRETVPTVMGKLLSMPTMDLGVSATASIAASRTKLCLLTLETSKGKALNLDKSSLVTANGCSIYSNSRDKSGITADTNAQATAAQICSVGGVDNKGAILSPTPVTDCPVLNDPLSSFPRPSVGACTMTDLKITGAQTLWPGVYCKGIDISGSAQVTLMPGVYVINDGPLLVKGSASLAGQNVGLFFTGDKGGARFDPDTTISLTAPKSGDMAGLLFFEDRSVSWHLPLPPGPKGYPPAPPLGSVPMREYRITSNNAPTLLGTIYLPAGRLIIDANKPVADRSAYTVVISRQLELNSGPNLYLNSNYAASDIPVPEGVGPKTGNITLTR